MALQHLAPLLLLGTITLASCGQAKTTQLPEQPQPTREQYADAIRAVIAQDKINKPKLGVLESILGASQTTIDNYAAELKSIELSRCPNDFREAYSAHARAWKDYSDASRANLHSDAPERAIDETWLGVHHIAEEYGVSDALSRN